MNVNIRDAVVSQMERKISAGEALAETLRVEEQARATLAAASSDVARARQEALRAGWSESELKKLGLIPSARAARSRATRSSAPTTADEHRDAGPADDHAPSESGTAFA